MKAIFDALNVAYNEREKRSFFQLNIQSLLFTFGTIAVLVAALLAIVAVPLAMNYLGLGPATEWIISIGRWPLVLIGVVLLLAFLYRYGPSRDLAEWRWLTPGALLAAGVWLIASMLFSWYAANFGSFNETYGSLGAAIGFMIWIWISAIIILVGAELNAETEHQTARDSTEGSPQPMGSRGAAVADSLGEART
jgi:membrane protein